MWLLTPSPAYDAGTSPSRTPRRGRKASQRCHSLRLIAAIALIAFAAACAPAPGSPPLVATVSPPPVNAPAPTSIAADRWRAILVAGDNSSPAFNNGVTAMRERLVAQGVRDIRVLSAAPSIIANAQLASASSVRRVVHTPGGEACMAFLTSHGERAGLFLSVDRTFLPPAAPERALTEGCGTLPTVLIVSACHSGVFADKATQRPNRVILTAAAPDRSSFGCGARDQYTYYDRCLLQQFDSAGTWRDLALSTRRCVEALEQRMGIRVPSQPQIFVGAEVGELRIPGR